LELGASVSVVARRFDVNANQVFSWRKLYRNGAAAPAAPELVPVMVKPDAPAEAARTARESMIEIDLAGRYRVRVDNAVDACALRRVLDVLERR
jgi:transposase